MDPYNMSRQFHGKGPEAIFPEGSFDVAPAPWPSASRDKGRADYDQELVAKTLRQPPKLQEVDPVELHATQRNITRQGVNYYAGQDYNRTGETFADKGNEGNRFPVVYRRAPGRNGQAETLILSGHHRAAAALAKGEPLRARIVEGGWGPNR